MRKAESKILPQLYLLWATVVISITFLKGGLNNDNITHLIILGIFGGSLFIFKFLKPRRPKIFFIFSCVILAASVEGAYMISKPVLSSLLLKDKFTLVQFIHNYSIDLFLTIPVYFLIFWIIWKLINKFNYSKWEYIILIALGQAVGDSGNFFLIQPTLLLFIPYIMINYHAMNVAPFLRIENFLNDIPKSQSKWKYLVTILAIFCSYFFGGVFIKIVASTFNIN